MIVKIGYIGSKHSVKQAKNVAQNMSGIKLKTYTYESPNDVSKLHQKAVCEVDVICFSGIVSYYYRNRSLTSELETVISPFHKYMVVASLLSLMINYQVTIDEVSIDLPDKRLLEKIEHDIVYQMNKNYVYDYDWIYRHDINKDLSFTNIAAFHERLYRQKKTKMAITSIHYVYDLLSSKNIPTMYMVDHDDNVKNVLDDARKRVLFSRLQDGMITAIYFGFNKDMMINQSAYQYITQEVRAMIHQPVHTHMRTGETIVFYTTRGMVEEQFLPKINRKWLKILQQTLNSPIYFGIGYGRELFEAEENAKQAFQAAQMHNESNGFLLTNTKELIGPLIGQTEHEYIRTYDDWLNQLLEQTNTTLKTMKRFIEFMQSNQYQPFTVREYAAFANITVRTSERFIKRLYNVGIVYIYGQEQKYNQGRPRQVYALVDHIESKFRYIAV